MSFLQGGIGLKEEKREVNALVVITAVGVVIGALAGLFVGAGVGPELHRILLLGASIVLFSSVTVGILVYKRPTVRLDELAEPVTPGAGSGAFDSGSEG